jgi:PAS domain S-box-containing protein
MHLPTPTEQEVEFSGGNFIYEIDENGYITYANRSFVSFVGYDKADLIGAYYADILDPRMPKTLFECMQNSTSKGETWKGYCKNLKSNGDYYWAVAYVTKKPDTNGYAVMFKPANKDTVEEVAATYEKVYRMESEGKDARGMIKNIIIGESA